MHVTRPENLVEIAKEKACALKAVYPILKEEDEARLAKCNLDFYRIEP